MATDLDVVITRFETEATQAIAELKNLRAAQQDANDNFEHGATSMRKADEATKSLGDRMRAFSREQRADARVGGYFAREFFDPFLTKGSKASELVNALGAGFAGGGAFGMGIELATVGMKWFAEELTHAQKEQEAAAKGAREFALTLGEIDAAAAKFGRKGTAGLEWLWGQVEGLGSKFKVEEANARKKAIEDELGLLKQWQQLGSRTPRSNPWLSMWNPSGHEKDIRAELGGITTELGKYETAVGRVKARFQDTVVPQEAFTAATEAAAAAAKTAAEAENSFFLELAKRQAEQQKGLEKPVDDATLPARIKELHAFAGAADQALASYDDYLAGLRQQAGIDQFVALSKERREAAEKEAEAYKKIRDEMKGMAADAVQAFAHDVAGALGKTVTGSAAYSKAMKAAGGATANAADLSAAAFAAMAQNALASLGEQAFGKSLFYGAEALAFLATGDYPSAAEMGAAAGEMAIVAGLAGAGAYGIGQGRGMTRAERQSLKDLEDPKPLPTPPNSGGSGSSRMGEDKVVREVRVVYVGDPFSTPAENAQRAARYLDLMDQLDLRKREGT